MIKNRTTPSMPAAVSDDKLQVRLSENRQWLMVDLKLGDYTVKPITVSPTINDIPAEPKPF